MSDVLHLEFGGELEREKRKEMIAEAHWIETQYVSAPQLMQDETLLEASQWSKIWIHYFHFGKEVNEKVLKHEMKPLVE